MTETVGAMRHLLFLLMLGACASAPAPLPLDPEPSTFELVNVGHPEMRIECVVHDLMCVIWTGSQIMVMPKMHAIAVVHGWKENKLGEVMAPGWEVVR